MRAAFSNPHLRILTPRKCKALFVGNEPCLEFLYDIYPEGAKSAVESFSLCTLYAFAVINDSTLNFVDTPLRQRTILLRHIIADIVTGRLLGCNTSCARPTEGIENHITAI